MSTTVSEPIITWEKLPDDFPLPDAPVDNINQPLLAAALTESLELAGRIQPSMLMDTTGLQALGYFWVYAKATKPIAQVTGCAGGMKRGKYCCGVGNACSRSSNSGSAWQRN